ncbi:MAG TPA: ribosome recycling factor [Actinomycetota bacterium]|nr:ribosome recycling factor [Actinomycetota bacterium]
MSTAPEILKDAVHKMERAVDVSRDEFATVRTGRASPSILNRITVDYYGAPTPLNQLASFSVPEPRLLVIQPFDRNSIAAIEKAIMQSDLGLTPSNDGQLIRLAFPPLTEERRKELTRVVRERAEDGRVAVRNVRRHAKEELERLEKNHEISEDELARAEKELQKHTDEHVAKIDDLVAHKEKELMEV